MGAAGANYGWNATEGPFTQASFPNFTRPIVYYHHGNGALSVPPLADFTGGAITGGAFYQPITPTFGAEYVNDYFFADYVFGWIKRYDPASNTAHNFASDVAGPVDLRVGNDGALYYLGRNAGRVYRVQINCIGDVNASATVDVTDLLAVITTWGPCANPNNCPSDMNDDNTVNVNDLLAVITHWGACP